MRAGRVRPAFSKTPVVFTSSEDLAGLPEHLARPMAALAVGMTVDFNGSGKYSKAPYAGMPGVIVAVNADSTKCQLKWDIKGKWDEMPGRTMLLSECTLHAAGDAGMTTPAKQRPPV